MWIRADPNTDSLIGTYGNIKESLSVCKKVLKNSHFLKQQVLIIGRILSAASCCGKFICKKFYFRGIFFPSDPDFDVFTHLKSSAIKLDQAVAARMAVSLAGPSGRPSWLLFNMSPSRRNSRGLARPARRSLNSPPCRNREAVDQLFRDD